MTHNAHPAVSANPPRRLLIAGAAVVATALAAIGAPPSAHAAVSTDAAVLINEVYGGGGNNGSLYNRDFVELVNTGTEDVDLTGWSVQYASASGSSWQVTPLDGHTIAADSFLLIGQAFGADETTPSLTADVDGSIALSSRGGKLALVEGTEALSGSTGLASSDDVIDYLGWGAASDAAGSPAPATTNSTSVSRDDAHTNTADNGADFMTGAPTPMGSGASNPDPDPDPEPDPEPGASLTIAEIQGSGDTSPYVGATVTTTGVVTATYPTGGLNGYVIQSAGTGGTLDLSTHTASDAVFVYAPDALTEVALGDTVEVTGSVTEFRGLTELSVGTGDARVIDDAEAPAPADVAWPASDTERESLESMLIAPQGPFTVTGTYSTNQYGEVALASGDAPLHQPTDRARPGSAEAEAIEADNAARAVVLDDGTSINFLSSDNSALTPAYVSLAEPIVVGAGVRFTEPFIVDWRNDTWKLNPTSPLTADGSGTDGVVFENIRTASPAAVGGDVSVASFNVLNFFTTLGADTSGCVPYRDRFGDGVTVREGCEPRGAWDADDLDRQREKIVAAINGLDASVVGLMEIENSAALGEATDEATASLVAALNETAGADMWAYVPSSQELPPASEQDVITNAIIYQPAQVSPVGAARALGDQSGPGEAFVNAREPLAQVFEPVAGGDPFLFSVNHFKSKGSVGPWPGDTDAGDGQGNSNESRVRQATALRDWIDEIRGDVEAVVLVGDFNSYGQEDPLQVLYDAGYADAEQALQIDSASYSYRNLSGSLDHVLLNDVARERATGGDIWNINSGESVALEYSRYRYHGTTFYAPDPYRSSDHDPVIVGLSAQTPPVELTLLGINDFHGRIDSDTVAFAGTVEQLRAEADGPVLFLSSGDNIGASLFASAVAQDQPTIDVLNALGLQASAVGNHEFDRGWADLSGRVADASDYPQLGANVYLAGTQDPALPEYALLEAEGLTIGVIGAVTEETPTLVSPAGITDLDFGNPVEAVNRVAAELSDGDPANGEADVLVALYHEGAGAGTPEGASLEDEIAAGGAFADIVNGTSAEIDAIFNGHTHKQYAWSAPIPGTDRTRPIVQTGSYGAHIGEISLTIDADSGEVLAHSERNVARTDAPRDELVATYPRVAAVAGIVDDALAAAAEIGNTGVAQVSGDITTAFSGGSFVDGVWTGGARDDRSAESALGNLVANTLRDSLADLPGGADIGVTNPGGLRSDLWDTQDEFGATAVPGLPDGTISFSQANAVLPFNNTLALVTLTGAQFTTLLEQQWQRDADGEVPSRPYLQLGLSDNVSYTFDASLPEGSRITSVTIDGEPLDPQAEYRIGTVSFLATGGDNFRVFTEGTDYVDTGLLDYEAWVDHLAEASPVTPSYAKHGVQVQGVPETLGAGETVEFSVSGLNMTSRGAPENTTLEVSLGGEALGTVPIADGSAEVSVTIPAGTATGAAAIVLTAPASATTVSVPVTIEQSAAASTTTLKLSRQRAAFGDDRTVRALARVSSDERVRSGEVEFLVDGEVIATAPVNRGGVAKAALALSADRAVGEYEVIARFTGTDDAAASESTPIVFHVTAAKSSTALVAFLPVHLNGFLPSTLFAVVSQRGGGEADGVVEFREGGADGTVIATVEVRNGVASHTLGRISRGTHTYTAVFVPSDEESVTGSTDRASVLALF